MKAELTPTSPTQGVLDPEDWETFRKLCYQAVDDAIEMTRSLSESKVWKPLPPEAREAIGRPVYERGIGETETYKIVKEHVLPYRFGNCHPRYWSRMGGSGFLLGSVADFLSSAMNSNTAAQESSGIAVEEAVLEWLKELLGLSREWSAVLTSGCSVAHVIGLTVCRNQMVGNDVNENGLSSRGCSPTLYCSDQTHHCIDKAVATIGLGTKNLRKIPTTEDYRLDIEMLGAAISADRKAGLKPACVVANAGTLATGAIDDLESIAELCREQGLWLHVDGAYGAFAVLSETLRPKLAGLDRADSIAVDLHKWLQMPYDVGCIFVRDSNAHRKAFVNEAAYLAATSRGPAAAKARFFELGLDLSRNCRALKVWMGLTSFGVGPFRQVIEQNVAQARYVAERVKREPVLELTYEPHLNVVCFRVIGTLDDDATNEEIALKIQESGIAMIQSLPLNGHIVLRLGIVNHRSKFSDFDVLIDEIVRLATTRN